MVCVSVCNVTMDLLFVGWLVKVWVNAQWMDLPCSGNIHSPFTYHCFEVEISAETCAIIQDSFSSILLIRRIYFCNYLDVFEVLNIITVSDFRNVCKRFIIIMCLNYEQFLNTLCCIKRCAGNTSYASRSRDLPVVMPRQGEYVCIDGVPIGRALSNRALERASLRRGFDTASRLKAVVAVTSAVRGAPPLRKVASGAPRGERHQSRSLRRPARPPRHQQCNIIKFISPCHLFLHRSSLCRCSMRCLPFTALTMAIKIGMAKKFRWLTYIRCYHRKSR